MKHQWLRSKVLRLQKFTRVDMRYLLSGGFFLTLVQISSALIGLVMVVAFANLISPEAYGTYKYILATYTLLTIAALPGVETAVLSAIAGGHDKAFKTGVKLKIKWSLLAGFLTLLYAFYVLSTGDKTLGMLFVLVAIALPFMESGTLFISYFNAKREYRRWTIIDIAIQIITSASVLAALYFSQSLFVLVIAYLFPHALIRLILTYYVWQKINASATDDPTITKYAYSVTFFQILTRVIMSIDQIVLFHFLGPASVAIFSIANAIPSRIKGIFKITGTLAFPKLVNQTGAAMYATLPRKMFLFGLFILFVCTCYVFFVPLFFTYVFPKYHDSIVYSQVLVFFTLASVTYPFSAFLFANKKMRENYIFAVLSVSAKILCLVIFVPLYGIWGAVFGVLAASAVTLGCAIYFMYVGRNETVLVPVANKPIDN